jgi:hypothetical protein
VVLFEHRCEIKIVALKNTFFHLVPGCDQIIDLFGGIALLYKKKNLKTDRVKGKGIAG